MGRYLVQFLDTASYMVLYIPTWFAWHLVIKHVIRILKVIRVHSEEHEEFEEFLRNVNLSALQQMLAHGYYNALVAQYQERLMTCGRSV